LGYLISADFPRKRGRRAPAPLTLRFQDEVGCESGRILPVAPVQVGRTAPEHAIPRADLQPGTAERLAIGPITCLLVPRALERPAVLTG
jgi:hypothetical protein